MERNKIITIAVLVVGIIAWRMGAMEPQRYRRMSDLGFVLGINPEFMNLPYELKNQVQAFGNNVRVLDVGAGDGTITKKMINEFGINHVCALEPGSEYDVASLRQNLPQNACIIPKTLQDAVISEPNFASSFDVVTVFKYNISLNEKKEFIKALAETVKPSGKVFMTSVEPERFHEPSNVWDKPLYLIDDLQEYFIIDSIERIEQREGRYDFLIMHPKQR